MARYTIPFMLEHFAAITKPVYFEFSKRREIRRVTTKVVADGFNDRIQKFDTTGTFLAKWGSSGSGNGQFSLLGGVTTDSAGDVYVSDIGNARVQKFDSAGTFLTQWGSSGTGPGQFTEPAGLAVDALTRQRRSGPMGRPLRLRRRGRTDGGCHRAGCRDPHRHPQPLL